MGRKAAVAIEGQTKVCKKCGKELPLEAFNKGNAKFGRRTICRECEHLMQNTPEKRKRRRELELIRRQNPEYIKCTNERDKIRRHTNYNAIKSALLRGAKQRAKTKGLDFNITIDDFEIPTECPLLNIPIKTEYTKASDNSVSLDRIDSSKGYIKDNIWVISRRANMIKSNATLGELITLTSNLQKKLKKK